MTDQDAARTANWYCRFAEHEAPGKSPLYAEIGAGIAGDEAVIAKLLTLPLPKRQPNLVLGSYRWLFGTAKSWGAFRSNLLGEWPRLAEIIMSRSTQTNEAGRCAVMMPILAGLPQPIALVEVGASAGLCLFPDHYGYDWNGVSLRPAIEADYPIFPCDTHGPVPRVAEYPQIIWRAGLDLNPLDVCDEGQMRWLETLIWPGQEERLVRLRQAIAIAREDPPEIRKGNLLQDLPALLEQAPAGATKVVFHTAVLNYVPDEADRRAFAAQVTELADCWISNESPGVWPVGKPVEAPPRDGLFVLAVNGQQVAWTDSHGAAIWWLDEPR